MKAGTVFQTVIACSSTSSSHASGSGGLTTSWGGTTTAAPAASIPKMSYTDRSKESDESASTRSDAPTSNRSFRSTSVLIAPAWWQHTPFGVPRRARGVDQVGQVAALTRQHLAGCGRRRLHRLLVVIISELAHHTDAQLGRARLLGDE